MTGDPGPVRLWVRVVAIVVVVGFFAIAVLLDRDGDAESETPAEVPAVIGPVVPASNALSTAWYCAEGTSQRDGRADERIVITNVSGEPAKGVLTVYASGQTPAGVAVEVAPHSQTALRVGDIRAAPDPGVVVELSGGRAVVAHTITANGDVGTSPCARTPSTSWYFAAGTTVKGAQLWIALFNPFGDDAIVDVSFVTDRGPLAPEALQGFVVPAHSRVAIPVHERAPRRVVVSSNVRARRGRLVADQSLSLDGSDGRKGLSLSLGTPDPARVWRFATAGAADGRTERLYLANPSTVAVQVQVDTHLDAQGELEPIKLELAPRSSIAVNVDERVPKPSGYALVVQARGAESVVAELLDVTTAPYPPGSRGIATTFGSAGTARRWVVSPARARTGSADSVGVANATGTPLRATLFVVNAGTIRVVPGQRDVVVPAARRVLFPLRDLGIPTTAAVVVEATGPVTVARESRSAPGFTVTPGLPDLSR